MDRSAEPGESGSILDVTDTPRQDVLRYAVAYPLAVVLISVGLVLWDASLQGAGFLFLLGVALASLLAAWWVTRTGEVGSPDHVEAPENAGGLNVEPSYGVHHVLTDDAAQRLRIVLFALGVVVWGVLGTGAAVWLLENVGVLPLHR